MPKNINFLLSVMTPPPPCWPPFWFLPCAFVNYRDPAPVPAASRPEGCFLSRGTRGGGADWGGIQPPPGTRGSRKQHRPLFEGPPRAPFVRTEAECTLTRPLVRETFAESALSSCSAGCWDRAPSLSGALTLLRESAVTTLALGGGA